MEKRKGKLVLRPMTDPRDNCILRAIVCGMSAREQTERIIYRDEDFIDRVRNTVSNLAVANAQHDSVILTLSSREAHIAVEAIRANTRLEQQSNHGEFFSKGSATANAAIPEIIRFAYG